MRVKVYYNLHKNIFPIQYKGVVLGYARNLKLKNVEFKVNQKGREKVIREQKKNIHAYVIGDLVSIDNSNEFELKSNSSKPMEQMELLTYLDDEFNPTHNIAVIYNPYKYSQFTNMFTSESVFAVQECDLLNKRIFI